MNKTRLAIFLTLVISLTLISVSFAEDAKFPAGDQVTPQASAEVAIYGEIKAVNAEQASISIQYYEYDADEERTIDILFSPDTKFENASGIKDVKPGDWADITYTKSDSKNLAKLITVEREEAEEELPEE